MVTKCNMKVKQRVTLFGMQHTRNLPGNSQRPDRLLITFLRSVNSRSWEGIFPGKWHTGE